tara:strand:- start:580 stop:726 length:147 start_codon:yes stop_codon:yes gene_type:complete
LSSESVSNGPLRRYTDYRKYEIRNVPPGITIAKSSLASRGEFGKQRRV